MEKYKTMETETLQAILREDAKKPAGGGMLYEELFPILEELVHRRECATGGKCLPPRGRCLGVYTGADEECGQSDC